MVPAVQVGGVMVAEKAGKDDLGQYDVHHILDKGRFAAEVHYERNTV